MVDEGGSVGGVHFAVAVNVAAYRLFGAVNELHYWSPFGGVGCAVESFV